MTARSSTSSPRTALVTGAPFRIGRCIAEHLGRAGYVLALHASPRSREGAEALAARLGTDGVRAHVLTGDLADAASCATLVERAHEAVGPLHLLVNNAAIFEADTAASVDVQSWDRHFAVNLRAPVLLTQAFAAQARDLIDPSVVNLIDQRVLRPNPQYFSYTLAKSALWTATRTMAQAFAPQGLRVNAVGPGPVLPNAQDGESGFRKEADGVPLRRAVDPGDIAQAVIFLAGARNVTGQMIAVDAGQHLGWHTPDVVD